MTDPTLLQQRGGIATYLVERDGIQYVRKVLAHSSTLVDLKALETEAQVLQNLDHPSIPKFSSITSNGVIALEREYCAGKSLSDHLKEGRLFSQDEAKYIGAEVLDALAYAHEKGIIHRDIKPGNIIYDESANKVSLVDFGFAKLYAFGGSTSSDAAGTFSHTAPEQFFNKVYPSSDIFGLGSTLIEILTGKTLDNYLLNDNLAEGFDLSSLQIEPRFKERLQRMVEVNPKKRYQSAKELKELLKTRKEIIPAGTVDFVLASPGTSVPSASLTELCARTIEKWEDKQQGFNDTVELEQNLTQLLQRAGYEMMREKTYGTQLFQFHVKGKQRSIDQSIEIIIKNQAKMEIYALRLKRKDLFEKLYESMEIYLGLRQNVSDDKGFGDDANSFWHAASVKTPEQYAQLQEYTQKSKEYFENGFPSIFLSLFPGIFSFFPGMIAYEPYYFHHSSETVGQKLMNMVSDSPIATTFCTLGILGTVSLLAYGIENIRRGNALDKQFQREQPKLLASDQIEQWKPYEGTILIGVDAIKYISQVGNEEV